MLDAVVAAHEDIGDCEARAIALRDRCNAAARAVVGVGNGIGLAVGDDPIVGREVGNDLYQPVGSVVAVARADQRLTAALERAKLREIVAGVIEEGGLAAGVADLGDETRGVVGEGEAVAVRIQNLVDAPAVGGVVALRDLSVPVRPGPGLGRAVEDQRIVSARAVAAFVLRKRGVVSVDRFRPVFGYARDRAACGVDRAGTVVDLSINAQAPVVTVVVVEQPLAVVGAKKA